MTISARIGCISDHPSIITISSVSDSSLSMSSLPALAGPGPSVSPYPQGQPNTPQATPDHPHYNPSLPEQGATVTVTTTASHNE